jgi:hypothetical protein
MASSSVELYSVSADMITDVKRNSEDIYIEIRSLPGVTTLQPATKTAKISDNKEAVSVTLKFNPFQRITATTPQEYIRTLTRRIQSLSGVQKIIFFPNTITFIGKKGKMNENVELLNEISYKEAFEVLEGKKTFKFIKGKLYDTDPSKVSIAEDVFKKFKNQIQLFIPTDLSTNQQGTALLWLLGVAKRDDGVYRDIMFDSIDEAEKMRNLLETFFHYHQFMEEKDIFRIQFLVPLQRMVKKAQPAIKKYQEKQSYTDAAQGEEVLLDNNDWHISAIHNKGAACQLGKGTKWCTAAPGLNFFQRYYKPDDPLFFFRNKKTNERFQFHYGSRSFMDIQDLHIKDNLIAQLHKILKQTSAYNKYPKIKEYDDTIVASNPDTPPEILKQLSKHNNDSIKEVVAKNPNTPPETLSKLSKYEAGRKVGGVMLISTIAYAVAKNPNTPEKDLIRLSQNSNYAIAVASNPNTPLEMLTNFSNSKDFWILDGVVSNPNTPLEILIKIFKKEARKRNINAGIYISFIRNPNVSLGLLKQIYALTIFNRDVLLKLHAHIAMNPNLDQNLFDLLSKSRSQTVRYQLAKNPNTPQKILSKLSKSKNTSVSNAALKNLNSETNSLQEMVSSILPSNKLSSDITSLIKEYNTMLIPSSSGVTSIACLNEDKGKEMVDKLRNKGYISKLITEMTNDGEEQNYVQILYY